MSLILYIEIDIDFQIYYSYVDQGMVSMHNTLKTDAVYSG